MKTEDLFLHATGQAVEARRMYLSRRIYEQTGGVVQRGLLAGYHIGEDITWRESDNACKLVGLYEQEVCDLISRVKTGRHTLVDLGGADGFYGVGLVATGHFRHSYCYEMEENSRKNIRIIASRSGVQDSVNIFGTATPAFTSELTQQGVDFADAVVLVDIEGAEFEVLTHACLAHMKDAHVIVELHDFLVQDGQRAAQDLIERAADFFDIDVYRTGARDLSGIPMFDGEWTDSDRWLVCSEGRAKLMSWLHFSPKERP
jgi:hypothetical protein